MAVLLLVFLAEECALWIPKGVCKEEVSSLLNILHPTMPVFLTPNSGQDEMICVL